MKLEQFNSSLASKTPPPDLSDYLQALWYDAKGDWQKAHEIIQDSETQEAAWIHAYLHRKEGDISNAGYWYGKAAKKMPDYSLEKEWQEIAGAMVATR